MRCWRGYACRHDCLSRRVYLALINTQQEEQKSNITQGLRNISGLGLHGVMSSRWLATRDVVSSTAS